MSFDCFGNHCQGNLMLYDDASFGPDVSIGYLVKRANQLGSTLLEPVFVQEGITIIQWSALVWIWFGRGSTAAELARELGHDKGAMTRVIDTIQERGWVTRERTTEDRRCIALALTPAGEAVALRCRTHVVALWNRWLADWPREEAEMLIALLQKLHHTLIAVEAGEVAA